MRSVNLRKVALAQQVREFEDVVLDLLVDGPLGRRLLLFYHYLYNLIISSGNSITASGAWCSAKGGINMEGMFLRKRRNIRKVKNLMGSCFDICRLVRGCCLPLSG